MEYKVITMMLTPNSTIEAIIRRHNSLNIDKQKLKALCEIFNQLNPTASPPKPYQKVQIPVLPEYC